MGDDPDSFAVIHSNYELKLGNDIIIIFQDGNGYFILIDNMNKEKAIDICLILKLSSYKNIIWFNKKFLDRKLKILAEYNFTYVVLDRDKSHENIKYYERCVYISNIKRETFDIRIKIQDEDEDKNTFKDNECTICTIKIENKIALVPCGHCTFCRPCIEKWKNNNQQGNKCPTCRGEFIMVINLYD